MGGKKATNKAVETTALETPEELEPIPHNDARAIAAEVNRLRGVVAELEAKFQRLIAAWGDPDDSTGEGETN